jgi:hypothetical protein
VDGVRVVFSKWGGRPHYEFDTVLLGEDEHGAWLGEPAGTLVSRPGVTFETDQHQVLLLPRDAPFVAGFYAPGGSAHCSVYVDISTVPVWRDGAVHAVDLDLDVVKAWSGRVWVDDEDEFAEHRVRYGYPDDIVALACRSCDAVLAAVRAGDPPYDGTAAGLWLGRLDAVMMER